MPEPHIPTQCNTCKFYQHLVTDSGFDGLCRYWPITHTGFPRTRGTNWCGKYKIEQRFRDLQASAQ